MRRYLLASLVAGLVYAIAGPLFVHLVLPQETVDEFISTFRSIEGAAGTDSGELGVLHVVLALAIRLLFGFLTMAAFAWFGRGRPRFRAARLAGLFALLGYVALLGLQLTHGLSVHAALVAFGYCVLETQFAAHLGALVWRKAPPKP